MEGEDWWVTTNIHSHNKPIVGADLNKIRTDDWMVALDMEWLLYANQEVVWVQMVP